MEYLLEEVLLLGWNRAEDFWVWLQCEPLCLLTHRRRVFPLHCFVSFHSVALQVVIQIALLFRITLEGKWFRRAGLLPIKLLSN